MEDYVVTLRKECGKDIDKWQKVLWDLRNYHYHQGKYGPIPLLATDVTGICAFVENEVNYLLGK